MHCVTESDLINTILLIVMVKESFIVKTPIKRTKSFRRSKKVKCKKLDIFNDNDRESTLGNQIDKITHIKVKKNHSKNKDFQKEVSLF